MTEFLRRKKSNPTNPGQIFPLDARRVLARKRANLQKAMKAYRTLAPKLPLIKLSKFDKGDFYTFTYSDLVSDSVNQEGTRHILNDEVEITIKTEYDMHKTRVTVHFDKARIDREIFAHRKDEPPFIHATVYQYATLNKDFDINREGVAQAKTFRAKVAKYFENPKHQSRLLSFANRTEHQEGFEKSLASDLGIEYQE